jgi:predicted nuclease with TOPRIM domain
MEILIMNKQEIAETLRKEVGQLEVSIKKLQDRCDRLKTFVLDLEAEIAGPETSKPIPDSQFRKVIDSVFGEKPKRPKR